MMTSPLRDRLGASWLSLLAGVGCPESAALPLFTELAARYTSPERHYHTLEHVASVLDTVTMLLPDGEQALAVALAAWFHDAVYDPRAGDNEEKSAQLARTMLESLHIPADVIRETARLILFTKTHVTEANDRAGKVLLDADLAILGAEADAYDRYAQAIRREYAWVPETEYRTGRRRVLEGFLARPRIYQTEEMFRRAEERARSNLRRECDALR